MFQGAEELDIGGGSRRRAKMEVAQMKEQLESQVGTAIVHHHLVWFQTLVAFTECK